MLRETQASSSSKRKQQRSSDEKQRKIPKPERASLSSSSKRKQHSSDEKQVKVHKPELVFSEEDEIHLLNTFLEITKESSSPTIAAASLFDRIEKSLNGEIDHTQLIAKILDLRHKYRKQTLNRSLISTPHDRHVFEISHQIWSENSLQKPSNGSKPPRRRVVKKKKLQTLDDSKTVTTAKLPNVGFNFEEVSSIMMEKVFRLVGNEIIGEGLRCLNVLELKRLNDEWRLQKIREAEIHLERIELMKEHKKLISEALGDPSDD